MKQKSSSKFLALFLLVLASLLFVPVASASVNLTSLKDATIAYWAFDEGTGSTAFDSTPNDNDGTLGGGTGWVQGKINTGVDGIVTFGSITDFGGGTGDFSISLWFNINSLSPGNTPFITNKQGGGDNRILLSTAGNDLDRVIGFVTRTTSSESIVTGPGVYNLDEWTHVVITRTGSTGKIYVNGVEESSGTVAGGNIGSSNDWSFMGREGDDAVAALGDELAIFNKVLSQEEIDFLYASGSPSQNQQYPFSEGIVFSASDEFTGDKLFNYSMLISGGFDERFSFEDGEDGWTFSSNVVRSTDWSSEGSWSAKYERVGERIYKEVNFSDVNRLSVDYNLVTNSSTWNDVVVYQNGTTYVIGNFSQGEGTKIFDLSHLSGVGQLSIGRAGIICSGFTCPSQEFYVDNILFGRDLVFESDVDGKVVLNETELFDGVYNITYFDVLDNGGYFNRTYIGLNVSFPFSFEAELHQSNVDFEAYEIVTGEEVTNFNVTINDTTFPSNETFRLSAGTWNATFSKEGWYNKTIEINTTPLTTTNYNFTDVYNSLINITARDVFDNSTVSNFSINISNNQFNYIDTYSTTTDSLLIPSLNNTAFNLTIFSEDISSQTQSVFINSSSFDYEFTVFRSRSLLLRFFDQATGNLVDDRVVTFEVISDLFSVTYNTTNGLIYATLLEPGTYIARYTANSYTERFYEFTVTPETGDTIDLYMIKEDVSTSVTIRIVDNLLRPLEGYTVKALKYNPSTNTYLLQESAVTNADGSVVMSLTLDDEFYRFFIEKDGVLLRSTNPSYIRSNLITLQVNTLVVEDDFIQKFRNLNYQFSFNNETNNSRLEYSESSGTNVDVCIDVFRRGQSQDFELGTVCSTGPSGVLLFNIPDYNSDNLYFAELKYRFNGDFVFVDRFFISVSTFTLEGRTALLLSFMMIATLVLTTYRRPSLMILIIPISLIILHTIGLLNVGGWFVLGPIVILSLIISFIVNRRFF